MNNPSSDQSTIGTGWAFPPVFFQETGTCGLATDELDIEQSLYILFHTVPGERPLLPDYGCDLRRFVFEPMNTATRTLIQNSVTLAINQYEPRISLLSVGVAYDNAGARLLISVEFVISTTNSRFNKVFPFYLEEGTYISQ